MKTCRPVYWRLAVLLTAASSLSGCAGYDAIKGEDNGVFFPAFRASCPLNDRENRHGLSDHAFELDVSRGRGNNRQVINAGQIVSLGGETVSGPADLQQVFSLDVASAAFRFRGTLARPVFIEFLGGILYTGLDLSMQSEGFSAEQRFHDGGAFGGVGIGARANEHLLFGLRFMIDLVPFNWNRFREMRSIDLSGSYWLTPSMALTGGYRQWKYAISRDNESDVRDLSWRGFALGAAFSF